MTYDETGEKVSVEYAKYKTQADRVSELEAKGKQQRMEIARLTKQPRGGGGGFPPPPSAPRHYDEGRDRYEQFTEHRPSSRGNGGGGGGRDQWNGRR